MLKGYLIIILCAIKRTEVSQLVFQQLQLLAAAGQSLQASKTTWRNYVSKQRKDTEQPAATTASGCRRLPDDKQGLPLTVSDDWITVKAVAEHVCALYGLPQA